jgi:lipoyl(octanoyl) transferase
VTRRRLEWRIEREPVAYEDAVSVMEARADAIRRAGADELIWLLEHPPLYTSGTSARPEELLDARFPVHATRRGGRYTYHGPGQRIVYVMLDLERRGRDVRRFVCALEDWVIATLGAFGVRGERRAGRVGVWVARPDRPLRNGRVAEDKIAAVGVRIRRWVSFHGFAVNVDPELSHFDGIVPCGLAEHGVTSLVDLGLPVAMADVDVALRRSFDELPLLSGPDSGLSARAATGETIGRA